MEQQTKLKAAAKKTTRVGSVEISDSESSIAGLMRRFEKKQRRKDRRKKKGHKQVDKVEVAKSFKNTMANLAVGKQKRRYRRGPQTPGAVEAGPSNVIEVNEFISVGELAKLMDHKPADLITKLFELGMMATINQRLDMDTIATVAQEFDFEVREIAEVGEYAKEEEQAGEADQAGTGGNGHGTRRPRQDLPA